MSLLNIKKNHRVPNSELKELATKSVERALAARSEVGVELPGDFQSQIGGGIMPTSINNGGIVDPVLNWPIPFGAIYVPKTIPIPIYI